MGRAYLTRRQFNALIAAGLMLRFDRAGLRAATPEPEARLRVAAIQMVPVLGDVQANLGQAEQLVRQAIAQGAQWVILPEMFTSAAAFHPRMLDAIQPLDGAPMKMLTSLARSTNTVVGGSYLARRGRDVYNSFVLALPDGSTLRHDKDAPTYWENCYYKGGEAADTGILETPVGSVGAALCWEFIRSRTARRLLGKINMLVGGSCWWTLPDDAEAAGPLRLTNLRMLQASPRRFARLLGVPFIHGSHAGPFSGFQSPDLPDVAYDSAYLGEAMVVDSKGTVLGRRGLDQGAGGVVADVAVPVRPQPSEIVPARFWIPEEMPEPWQESWERWFGIGARYYETVTLPYLDTGVINEYVPEWMAKVPETPLV